MRIKYILLLPILVLLQSCVVSSKPNINFFQEEEYRNNLNFTSVNIPLFLVKPYVKRALRKDGESEEVINIIKKITKVKVMTVENSSNKMLADFSKYLTKNKYKDWMSIKHDNENIDIKAIQNDNEVIKKLMLTVHNKNEIVFVDISGNFKPEDVSRVIHLSENDNLSKN